MKKVLMSCVLAICVVVVSSFNVSAAQVDNESISPLYTNMSAVTATLVFSDGTALCQGTCTLEENLTTKIILTLQRRKVSGAFGAYGTWTNSYTGLGTKVLYKTKNMVSGYYYRVKVEIQLYSGSTMVEATAKYTSEKYY